MCVEGSPNNAVEFYNIEGIPLAYLQVVKSVIALLRYYAWNKFSILYEEVWGTVADLLKDQASKRNMTINHKQSFIDDRAKCCEQMMTCCRSGYWYQVSGNYGKYKT